jgi:hypothetical protein
MKIKILTGIFFSLALLALTACGGGGGGTPATPTTPAPPTIISGIASKGQFVSGAVKIFGIDPVTASKGALLRTTALDVLGNYSADISPYTGPIIIEVTGRYKDEATGQEMDLDPATPLRAIISNAEGNVVAMVTPLTELAMKKAGTVLTKTVIDTMNANIAALFKVDDITKTKPVDAASAASASATEAEKNHGLALAAISQLAKNSGKPLGQVLDDLAADISGSIMADRSLVGYKIALFDFMSGGNNRTGLADPAATTANIGTFKLAHVELGTQGLAVGGKIGAIDFTFNLPEGVTISADATTKLAAQGIVVVSGPAAVGTSISLATFNQPTLRVMLANANGFGGGEFVDIGCTIAAGATVTTANFDAALSAVTPTVTDLTGAPIAGVTLTSKVTIF